MPEGHRPRVLLDVSPISARPENRTGLARVALALAQALASDPTVNIRTCAWGSLFAAADFESVRREFPDLNGIPSRLSRLEAGYIAFSQRYKHWFRNSGLHRIGQALNQLRAPLSGVNIGAFDLIHSTYARVPRSIRRASMPTVMTFHDLIPLRMPAAYFNAGEIGVTRRIVDAARSVSFVACVSEHTRQDFLDYSGVPQDRVVVIPNAVDPSVFFPETDVEFVRVVRERFGVSNRPFLLTLSSLAPHKNLRMLLEAWNQCPGAAEGLLVVAGGRTTDPAALMRALGLQAIGRNTVLPGFISDEEFRALASSCQAFVFPSLYEGFGLPALEAMACGAPVICSRNTALPEVVGDAGILLDPSERDAWTDAMLAALQQQPRTLPFPASLKMASQFAWQRVASQYISLYRRVLQQA